MAVLAVGRDPVIGEMVVETNTVSVVMKVVLTEAGQFAMADGHAVIVAVRVEKTVEVVYCPTVWACPEELAGSSVAAAVACAPELLSVTGQTVVET